MVQTLLLIDQRLDANAALLAPGAPTVLPCFLKELWLVAAGFFRGADHGTRPPNQPEAARLLQEHVNSARALGASQLNFASCAPSLTPTTAGLLHLATWAQDENVTTRNLDDVDEVPAAALMEEVLTHVGESDASSLAACVSRRPGADKTHMAHTGIVTATLNHALSKGNAEPFVFDTMPAATCEAKKDNAMNILTSDAFTTANADVMSGEFLVRQLAEVDLRVVVVQGEVNRKLLRNKVTTLEELTNDELLGFKRKDFSFSSGPDSDDSGIHLATVDTASGTNHFLVLFVPSLGTAFSRCVGTATLTRNVHCLMQIVKWMDTLLGRSTNPCADTENPLCLVSSLGKDAKASMAFAQAVVGCDGPEWKSPSQLGGEASTGGKASIATHGNQVRDGGKAFFKKHGVEKMSSMGKTGGKKGGKKINCKAPGCTAAPGTCRGRHNQKNCSNKASGAKPITNFFPSEKK